MSCDTFAFWSMVLIALLAVEVVVGHMRSGKLLRQLYGCVLTAVFLAVAVLGLIVGVEQSPKRKIVAQAETKPVKKPCMRSCDYDWHGLKVSIRGTAVTVFNPAASTADKKSAVEVLAFCEACPGEYPRHLKLDGMTSSTLNLHSWAADEVKFRIQDFEKIFRLSECKNCLP